MSPPPPSPPNTIYCGFSFGPTPAFRAELSARCNASGLIPFHGQHPGTDKIQPTELKETHLGPLANTFSRSASASTSTITEKDDKSQGAISATPPPNNVNTIGTLVPALPCVEPEKLRRFSLLTADILLSGSRLRSPYPGTGRHPAETRHPRRYPPRRPRLLPPRAAPKCICPTTRRELLVHRECAQHGRLYAARLVPTSRRLLHERLEPPADLFWWLQRYPNQPRPYLDKIHALRPARLR